MAKAKAQSEQGKNASGPASPQLSLKRKRVFRLVVVLSPFVILLVLELALRVIGYGYPTDFFIESATPGFLVTNDKFAAQFFSKRNTSRPVYCRLAVQKPAGTIRIFVLGESAAMGTPDPAFAFCRILEIFLQRQFPEDSFEVVNAAMRGIDSHVVRRIALDCAKHDPDLFIVYAGNNEVVGLHGPEPGSSRISQWLPLIRTSQWLKSTKIGQLTKRLVGGRASSRAETQDMEFFRKKRLWAGDPRRAAVHRNFQSNLEDICRAAARAKANVVL